MEPIVHKVTCRSFLFPDLYNGEMRVFLQCEHSYKSLKAVAAWNAMGGICDMDLEVEYLGKKVIKKVDALNFCH